MSASSTLRRLSLVAALLLPILAVLALTLRAESVVRTGREWSLRLGGYDPRDLLRGQYLRYQIHWKWQPDVAKCEGSDCCYCLDAPDPAEPLPPEPTVRLLACAEAASCGSYFPDSKERELSRFFIPEGEGTRLEQALRDREARLLIRVTTDGRVAVRDLLIDGRPWRESRTKP